MFLGITYIVMYFAGSILRPQDDVTTGAPHGSNYGNNWANALKCKM